MRRTPTFRRFSVLAKRGKDRPKHAPFTALILPNSRFYTLVAALCVEIQAVYNDLYRGKGDAFLQTLLSVL